MPSPYKPSFTAAGLSINESIRIAETYLACRDWDETKRLIKEQNLLQSRTGARTVRTYRELAQRLQLLSVPQLELLVEANSQEQKYLLWYAVCKRYRLVQEFAIEVVREKFLRFDLQVSNLDYEAFFNRKADWAEELDRLAETTRVKLKTVLFRMMREAGITTGEDILTQALLSRRLIDALKPDAPDSYRIFPLLEADTGVLAND